MKHYREKTPEEKLLRKTYLTLMRMFEKDLTEEDIRLFCIRLLFTLYADQYALLKRTPFLTEFLLSNSEEKLKTLFEVLGTPKEKREIFSEVYLELPYFATGLFDASPIIPEFDRSRFYALLELAENFKRIKPADFSAFLESFLSSQTRQDSGSFYTSSVYIHRVIDPLFLDALEESLEESKDDAKKLNVYLRRLSRLHVLDPACGTGNFLIESYTSLKTLEERARAYLAKIEAESVPEGVHLGQFYGIELNPLSIAIAQSLLELNARLLGSNRIEKAHLYNENALRIDWETLLSPSQCDYIIGNPPFLGARVMNARQKAEVYAVFGEDWENVGNLDYSSCWFKKAFEYTKGSSTRTAFLSTSSIVQGESVYNLWRPLFASGLEITFAHQSFHWKTISRINTGVYCVVIGFGGSGPIKPVLYTPSGRREVSHINGYLQEGENICIKSRRRALFDAPKIGIGNKPVDGGYYLFTEEEMIDFLKTEPRAKAFFFPFYGSEEYLYQKPRYCLYLKNCSEEELKQMPHVQERIERVRTFRENSKSAVTRSIADTPTRFHVENVSSGSYLLIPRSTSEKRDYIPIGFMEAETLCSDAVHMIPDASLYHFGILTSNVHMEWVRAVGGRMGNGYRYSKNIVYNNFPWPEVDTQARDRIEKTAKQILKVRAEFTTDLATLYERDKMPEKLKKAHLLNDEAVLEAYGLDKNENILKHLFERYQNILDKTLD